MMFISMCMIIPHSGPEERSVVCHQASALATSSCWTWTFFFPSSSFFWFSYGDYSFGRALKTTVGRGEGEAAGLKDRIKQGGGVKQCIKDGETERRRC